jgi:hypothetical protein
MCGGPAEEVHCRFKAPPASKIAQWKKVRYLIEHGFRFQTLGADGKNVRYPATLKEAEVWVKNWAHRAIRYAT